MSDLFSLTRPSYSMPTGNPTCAWPFNYSTSQTQRPASESEAIFVPSRSLSRCGILSTAAAAAAAAALIAALAAALSPSPATSLRFASLLEYEFRGPLTLDSPSRS